MVYRPLHTGQFLFYLVCGIVCSNLKVSLPGVTGTLSVNYLFILVSVTELTLPETVLIGCTSGVAQLFWAATKRPRHVQVLFTFAGMTLASALTYTIYHAIPGSASVYVPLLFASGTYFLSNTGTVALIVALTAGQRLSKVWRESFFWTGPHYLVGGALTAVLHFSNAKLGWQSSVLVFPTVYLIYRSYRLYLGRLAEEKRHVAEVADLHLRTIQSLALAIDARDGTTHAHLRRVQVYARELARELGLSEEQRRALEAAALLHDIGKLAVPQYIISKPGKLTAEEFEKMKVHPVVGGEILESVQFPYPVVPIVRAHHEKWDGSGYPSGLRGEEIPIGARILSAVDCLDALASDRQYRRALPLDEAMRHIRLQSGVSFDPRVVEVLGRRYLELEKLARAQTPVAPPPLSTDIRVERGAAPDAGLAPSAVAQPSSPGFLASIAAAREEFQMLLELTQEMARSLRVDEMLALLAARLQAVIPYHGVAIYTLQSGCLVAQYAWGEDAALFSTLQIPLGEGISGWVAQNNKPILNGNPSVEPGYLNDPGKFSTQRSALSVPLPGLEGVIGTLSLYQRESGAFTKEHLRVLLAVSSKAGLMIEKALRIHRAEHSATTDPLTGLANIRSLFTRLHEELQRAGRNGASLAVLVADTDGFKQVNDQFGHTTGNRVLEGTAQALLQVCRTDDYAARMGGDEFVLLLRSGIPGEVGERITQLNHLVAAVGRRECGIDSLRLSTGVSYYPDDGNDAEELLAKADERMYETKRQHHAERAAAENLTRLAHAVEPAAQPGPPPEVPASSNFQPVAYLRPSSPG
jgi:diguanylate cyclase (GGDEF)-like protein/putative nucleotidyltransferase with HDIG domain